MAISYYVKWDPVATSQMKIMSQNNELIEDVTAGARDFISNIQSRLSALCGWLLTDLVAYDLTDPLRARRWKTAAFMMTNPWGFRRFVDDMIQLMWLRTMIRMSGDPTGEMRERIDALRASAIHIVDYALSTIQNM